MASYSRIVAAPHGSKFALSPLSWGARSDRTPWPIPSPLRLCKESRKGSHFPFHRLPRGLHLDTHSVVFRTRLSSCLCNKFLRLALLLLTLTNAICFAGFAQAEPRRIIGLWPESVVRFSESPPTKNTLILFTHSAFPLGQSNCFFALNQRALIYRAFQAGVDCAFLTGPNSALAGVLKPELAHRQGKGSTQVRPALLAELKHSFAFQGGTKEGKKEERKNALLQPQYFFTSSLSYKAFPKESHENQVKFSKSGFNPYGLQRLADVLESHYSLALHSVQPWGATPEALEMRLEFLETLPLALRRGAGISETAALQYKHLQASVRVESSGFVVGGGLAYAVFTFDSVRATLALPTLQFGFLF
jgi:hypothetical protein